MSTEHHNFIGGQHVKSNSGRMADVYNPATGEVQAQVALSSAAEGLHTFVVGAARGIDVAADGC